MYSAAASAWQLSTIDAILLANRIVSTLVRVLLDWSHIPE